MLLSACLQVLYAYVPISSLITVHSSTDCVHLLTYMSENVA